MQTHKRRAILIAGPTASGKSGAAIGIAQQCGGVVVNGDSMQVYRQLRVLTSRPDARDEALVAHRLYGHVDGALAYSTGQWLADAQQALRDIWADGAIPVITGGTGLYFRSLQHGLAKVPEISCAVRCKWRERLKGEGAEALHEELARRDEREAARLKPGDGQRIVRALEVLEATGRPLASFHSQAAHESVLSGVEVTKYLIMPARDELYQRINRRFDLMMAAGALDEVKALRGLGIGKTMPVMKAIGVKALGAFLDGSVTLDEALETARRETRNYAKRQMTWARGQMKDWPVFESPDALGAPAAMGSAAR